MDSHASVSHWLDLVRAGDPQGAEQLWQRYFEQMVRFARSRLGAAKPGRADEEDLALSAFASFCRRAEQGLFPSLADREELWRLLIVITARKTSRLLRDERRLKRGGDREQESLDIERLIGDMPTPEFVAQCADECRLLLGRLRDRELEKVALWKMEGCSNDEIAVKLDCTPRTVERKLHLIRHIWEQTDS